MDSHLKTLFTRYREQFGSGPGLGPGSGTCLFNVEHISPSFIKSIYKAAAALYRTDPWKRLRPDHLFGVKVGKDSDWAGKKQPFPCIQFIGGNGGDLAVYMFRSENDARKTMGSRETIRVPNVEIMRATYELESLMFPSHKKMIKLLSLESSGGDRFPVVDVCRCNTSGELECRNPTIEELRFMYGVMKSVSLIHPLLQRSFDLPKWSKIIVFEPFIETVDVEFSGEMSKGNDLVAVTVAHPPGQGYVEKPEKFSGFESTPPTKDTEFSDDGFSDELAINVFTFPCNNEHPCKWLEMIGNGVHQKGMWRRRCPCYAHCLYGLLPATGKLSDSWGGLDDGDYPHDSLFHRTIIPDANPTRLVLLSGWQEYYDLRSLPLSSPVSDILSHPLTIYYILTMLSIPSKNLLLAGKELIIHYIGPENELDWMPAFAEISHLLNGTGTVQIVMVGPGVPANLSGSTSGIGSRVRVKIIRGVYQEEAPYLSLPHVVVGLNCGFDSYSGWAGVLELVKSKGVPAFFTEQSEMACLKAKQVIRGAGLVISHPVMPNPFRSPVRNYGLSGNGPSYSNGFVLGVNT